MHAGEDAASDSPQEFRTAGAVLSTSKEPLVQDMQKLHGSPSRAIVTTGSVVQEDVENRDHVTGISRARRTKTHSVIEGERNSNRLELGRKMNYMYTRDINHGVNNYMYACACNKVKENEL